MIQMFIKSIFIVTLLFCFPMDSLRAEDEYATPIWDRPVEILQQEVNALRAGKDLTPKIWPNGSRVAVGLSFDFDTETVWMQNGKMNHGAMSRGEYGARVGVPRILRILDKYGIPATFFVPAINIYLHPDALRSILSKNRHEIGFHSWIHENSAALEPAQEREMYRKSMQAWQSFMGKAPVGARLTSDFTPNTANLLREFGFIYDSTLMADDRPYMLRVNNKDTGIIELPIEWINDDWFMFQIDSMSGLVASRNGDDVFTIWREQFDKAYEEGTTFTLVCHPQVIGHGYRIRMLEKLIEYIKSKPGVWFATHEQISNYLK